MASNSHLSYDDVRDALDRALNSERGIRIYETTPQRIIGLRQRIHKLKSLERIRSKKLYPEGHPSYNVSPYDKLSILTSETILRAEPPGDRRTPEWKLANSAALAALPTSELYIDVVKRVAGALQVEDL